MFNNRDVQRLIKLKQHSRIKFDFFFALHFEHECFVEDRISRASNTLRGASVFKETDRYLKMLVLAHIYEVDECGTLDNIAAQVPFVGVKTVFGHLALAWNILGSCLWLAVTLRGGNCAFAGMRNRMQDFVKNSL